MQRSRYATTLTEPRTITLEGLRNFRDIGGYTTRSGRTVHRGLLFRSDGQDALTHRDADRLMDDLHIGAVIDVRSTEELHRFGPSLLVGRDVPMFHIPIVDGSQQFWANDDQKITSVYLSILDEAGARFAATLELLAELDVPTTIHGAAGKDRTGLVAALLLSVLGVGDRGIGSDYAKSAQAMPAMAERYDLESRRNPWRPADERPMHRALATEMQSAKAATITTAMMVLRVEHGSVEKWLVHNGLDASVCPALRHRFLR